jgi:diguanylate cyclase (GGDEF)-like protein
VGHSDAPSNGEPAAPAPDGAEGDLRRRRSDAELANFGLRFAAALESGDPGAAEAIADEALQRGIAVEEIYSHVIAVAMNRIGHLWQEGKISIASEHLATAISQGVMARLFPHLLRGKQRSRERVMLAATQGEHHVLGLRMVADTLEGAGFDVRYLGADVPLEALLEACRVHAPSVLLLAASMPLNVPTMIWEIGEVGKLGQPPSVMAGGGAARLAIEKGLDVPVVENCEDVVRVVEEMIENPQRRPPVQSRLAARVPQGPSTSEIASGGEGTVAHGFSATSLAAAEAARETARHAFRLEELAYRDGLTGLWNRRAYDDRMVEMSEADGPHGAALMLDVDNFKEINDTFGHDAGDEALIEVGRVILEIIRPADFGGRYGGDEFVVLLPGTDSVAAADVAERIRAAVQRELGDPPVTISVGVSDLTGDARQTSLAVDRALYEAKSAGRNRVAQAEA